MLINGIDTNRLKVLKSYGYSMMPLLQDGDILYISKKKFNLIKINDIVCVVKHSKIFTHRVIYRTGKFLITKGDANERSDGKIYPRNIIGVVDNVKRGGQTYSIETFYLIQSTMYFDEIVRVKKALTQKKITPVFLKGLPLHLYFNQKQPSRIYRDCDILIKNEDFGRAERIFKKLGYQKIKEYSIMGREAKNNSEVSYIKFKNGFPIIFDVHKEVAFLMTEFNSIDFLYSREKVSDFTEKIAKEQTEIIINNKNSKY